MPHIPNGDIRIANLIGRQKILSVPHLSHCVKDHFESEVLVSGPLTMALTSLMVYVLLNQPSLFHTHVPRFIF